MHCHWPPHTRIETARLLLRPPQREDFDGYVGMIGDPQAAQFIGGVQARSTAWRSFMTMVGAWHMEGFAMFSVLEKSSGQWLGRVGPWQPEGWPGTEVGWSLHRAAWGKGFAAEAAVAAIDWAFEHLGWDEVIHTIHPDNHASIRLAERLGSRHRGPAALPPPHQDIPAQVWAQSRAQWLQRRADAGGHVDVTTSGGAG